VLIDDVTYHQLWVPPGFAHSFLGLSEVADFCCLCSEFYHPQSELGIAWNEPALVAGSPALAENTAIKFFRRIKAIHPQKFSCIYA
jgi:dTDP-4-dehydrorhamnose 3,5-epimerase